MRIQKRDGISHRQTGSGWDNVVRLGGEGEKVREGGRIRVWSIPRIQGILILSNLDMNTNTVDGALDKSAVHSMERGGDTPGRVILRAFGPRSHGQGPSH